MFFIVVITIFKYLPIKLIRIFNLSNLLENTENTLKINNKQNFYINLF